MSTKITAYFGQGPKIIRPAIGWIILSVICAWLWPDVFRLQGGRAILMAYAGWILIIAGLTFYWWGLKHMMKAVQTGKLDTSGPFEMVRHPMYSAWIIMILPGIAMASGVWPIFITSFIAWLFFRKWAVVEEEKLIEQFGQPYEEYRQRVGPLIPFM